MNLDPSHLVFLGGIAAYIAIRAVFQRRTSSGTKAISKTTARDRLLVVLVGTAQIALPLLLLFTPWLDWAHYTLPSASIWLGAFTMLCALWLFWRSHADLGKSWSVSLELNRDHQLVTEGVYRRLRHPMYASFFALGIAQALLLNNWLVGWAAFAAVSVLYVLRVPHEEKMMLEFFGEQYRSYMQRTGGIVPRLRSSGDT